MSYHGWIIQALFTGLVAGLGLFIGNYLYDRWKSPRLRLEEEEVADEFDGRRLKVRNQGKRQAENCIGKIILENVDTSDIATRESLPSGVRSGLLDENNFTQIEEMSLDWASFASQRGAIDINADDWEALLVLKIRDEAILISSEEGFTNPRCYLKHPSESKRDKYIGQITVTAGNAESVTREFEISEKQGRVELGLL